MRLDIVALHFELEKEYSCVCVCHGYKQTAASGAENSSLTDTTLVSTEPATSAATQSRRHC